MRFLLIIVIASFFPAAVAFAEECSRPRYRSTRDADMIYRNCVRRTTFGFDDVVSGIASVVDSIKGDDDGAEPDLLDDSVMDQLLTAIRSDSLTCTEGENMLNENLHDLLEGQRFVRIGDSNRYRWSAGAGNFFYISTSGSPEKFKGVGSVKVVDKKPDVLMNCSK